MKIVMLGYGNVAAHLVRALESHSETEVIQIFNRSEVDGNGLPPVITHLEAIEKADVYIMAIPDDSIGEFSESLPFDGRLVVHTSGSVPLKALSDKNRKGIFYPLQSFTRGRAVAFKDIPICCEAETEADKELLMKLAGFISEKVVEIDSKKRRVLHLGAVFLNNFVNHLYHISEEILSDQDLEFELLHPLLMETAEKIKTLSPKQAQTGPAVRNDTETIKAHLKLLQKKQHKKIYKALTKSIQHTHGKKL